MSISKNHIGEYRETMQHMSDYFPTWWTMIGVDCFMTILALIATAIVVWKWKVLKTADATSGCITILGGIWIGLILHILDLWMMIFLPNSIGNDAAMAAMYNLHLKHSWYINTISSVLIFVGLVISIAQFVRQMKTVEARGRALEESGNLLDSIFLNVPVGLVVKDRNHVVERVNRTYLSWYGHEAEIQIGTRAELIRDYQSAEDATVMNAQEDEVLATGRTLTREVERTFVDGKVHTLNITKFPVHGKRGEISKVGSVSVDLTDLVAAKQHAEKALMEVEFANRAKTAFLANMSHELRTPLNAIIGFSEAMLAQIFGPLGSEKYVEQIKAVHRSGHHLLDLVNDVLDMAKIESEEYELSPEEFNLGEIIGDTFQLVVGAADKKNLKLIKKLPQPVPMVTSDKRAMKQILLNLVSNAVKFTPCDGRVSVEVNAGDEDLLIVVEDNGPGIPAADIPNITRPFHQGSRNPVRASGEGTGLGLSIVSSLIKRHQGKLEIESEIGKGTRVSVSFPGVLQDKAGQKHG